MTANGSQFDVAVVGGGIVGLAVARALALGETPRSVCVLEREPVVGTHQTGHNSGVVHAGIYYAPGSLKARLCVEGAREMWDYCERHELPLDRCGKLIVARTEKELPALDELERRGQENGVPGLRRLRGDEIAEVEPHCTGVAALHSPATGIVDYAAVARAMADELTERGATVHTGAAVDGIDVAGGAVTVRHGDESVRAGFVVTCAGSWSDRVAASAGAGPDPRMLPFRGTYLKLRPERRALVRGLIYPVPDPSLPFLGVHLTRHVDGEVSIGPTALLSARELRRTLAWPGTWRMARRWWRTGLSELHTAIRPLTLAAAASEYVPGIGREDLSPYFAGTRAQAVGRDGALIDDFSLSETERALHVRNAPSPAATSAFAIGREIAGRVERRLR